MGVDNSEAGSAEDGSAPQVQDVAVKAEMIGGLAAPEVVDPKWRVTAAYDTRADLLWTNRAVRNDAAALVEVLIAIEAGATEIKVRPLPMPKLAYVAAPDPDPVVMRDYIDKLTRFFIDNPQWVQLADEARGYIGVLAMDSTTDQTQIEAQTDAASGMLAALKTLVAKHDRPHGFDDSRWYAGELQAARDAIREAEAAGIVAGDC